MQWIDLSDYGLKLMDVEVPSTTPGVTTRVWVMANGDRHPEECKTLGFVRLRNGAWVTPSPTVRPAFADIAACFPSAVIVEDVDPSMVRMSLVVPAPVAAPVLGEPRQLELERVTVAPSAPEPEVEDEATVARRKRSFTTFQKIRDTSRFLGLNRRGLEAYDSDQGRYYKDKYDVLTFEIDVSNTPALFLRATDEAALAGCAEGFVQDIESGKILRFEDLRNFTSVVFDSEIVDTDPRLARANLAIEGALARALSRKAGSSMRDVYQNAIKIQEGHQYVADLNRHQNNAASVPPMVAVVVQRILGTEADLAGKTVAIRGGGAGALFTHIPREVTLRVYEPDPEIAVHVGATMLAVNRSPKTDLFKSPADYAADLVVANLPRGLLDKPRDISGMRVGRSDLAEMLDSLAVRIPGGRSIFLIQGGGSPEEVDEFERVRARIGSEYYTEGAVDIDGGLHSGNPAADPMRLFIVGQRRPDLLPEPPEAAMRVSAVSSASNLWSWTVDVVNNRAKIAKFQRDLDERVLAGTDETEENLNENSYQTPYQSPSGPSTSMVPRALEGATRVALGKIVQKHGDLKEWVGSCLAMTQEQLTDVFSPEQIDAMSMIFDAHDRGRGALNADQTGLGKGRTIAGTCRRAVVSGGSNGNLSRAIVLTERETNISDLIRDIRHIRSEDEFSILIINDNCEVINEDTGEVIMRSERRDVIQAIMKTGEWPEQYNLIIATYSQFNKEIETPESIEAKAEADAKEARRRVRAGLPMLIPVEPVEPAEDTLGVLKAKWLKTAIGKQTLMALDECHNVSSGNSNSYTNVDRALENCGDVLFLSGTYAKNAKNMQIYGKLLPPDFNKENLTEVIRRGGETMQETFSEMLVLDGVMIRREHDLSACTFKTLMDDGVDKNTGETHLARNERIMDLLAPILSEIGYLSGSLNRRIGAKNTGEENDLRTRLMARDDARVRGRGVVVPQRGAPQDAAAEMIIDVAMAEAEDARDRRRARGLRPGPAADRVALRAAHRAFERAVAKGMKSLQISKISFGSPLYLITRMLICSLLVEKAADEAIQALLSGKKPVIMVENTVQGLLEEMAATQGENGTKAPDFKDLINRTLRQLTTITRMGPNGREVVDIAINDTVTEMASVLGERFIEILPPELLDMGMGPMPLRENFKQELIDLVDRIGRESRAAMLSVDIECYDDAIEKLRQVMRDLPDNAEVAAPDVRDIGRLIPGSASRAIARIKAMIDTLPDLPVSAIDAVRDIIETKGRELAANGTINRPWVMGEITGRRLEYRDGIVQNRLAMNRTETKNSFNSGLINGVIINVAGSTGIDLHAGCRFLDQSQRVFIGLQLPADTIKEAQGHGRVHRLGQRIGPIIITLVAGLPVEVKLQAMRNTKFRRLFANVTGNRDSHALTRNIPDLMNPVGDVVCSNYLAVRPDLIRLLDLDTVRKNKFQLDNAVVIADGEAVGEQKAPTEDESDNNRSANEIMSRFAFLKTALQKQHLSAIDSEYKAVIEELDANGGNPLKTRVLEHVVHIRKKGSFVFDGLDTPNFSSEFYKPVYATRGVIDRKIPPLRANDVAIEAEKGLMALGGEGMDIYAERLDRRRESILWYAKPPEAATVADAIQQGNPLVKEISQRLDRLIATLRDIKPGCAITLTADGVEEKGILTFIYPPSRSSEHVASAYYVDCIIPGDIRPRRISLQSLIRDPGFKIEAGLNGEEADQLTVDFNSASDGKRLEPRWFLTGNAWRALSLSIEHKLGSVVNFIGVSEDNKTETPMRGILVSSKHKDLSFLPVALGSPEMVMDFLNMAKDKAVVFGNDRSDGAGFQFHISQGRDGHWHVTLPTFGGRAKPDIYQNPEVQRIIQETNTIATVGKRPKMQVKQAHMAEMVNVIMNSLGDRPHLFVNGKHREWATEWMTARMNSLPVVPARAA